MLFVQRAEEQSPLLIIRSILQVLLEMKEIKMRNRWKNKHELREK